MFPNTQKLFSVLVLSIALLTACGGSPAPAPSTAPVISAIYPNSGPKAGGTAVTITGARFASGASVSFGLISASVTSVTATQIVATTPANISGAVGVTVVNPDRQSATLNGGFTYVKPTAEEYARTIIEVFGVKEWAQYLGVTIDPVESTGIPFTEATLRAKSTTHILVYVPSGVSILDIQAKLPAGTIAFCDAFNAGQPFASDNWTNVGWYLIRKDVVPGTLGLLESDQYGKLIWTKEVVPRTRHLVFALVGHYLTTGEVLMPGIFARAADSTWPGGTNLMTTFAGGNAYGGKIGICSDWGEINDPLIGLSSNWGAETWLIVP